MRRNIEIKHKKELYKPSSFIVAMVVGEGDKREVAVIQNFEDGEENIVLILSLVKAIASLLP